MCVVPDRFENRKSKFKKSSIATLPRVSFGESRNGTGFRGGRFGSYPAECQMTHDFRMNCFQQKRDPKRLQRNNGRLVVDLGSALGGR